MIGDYYLRLEELGHINNAPNQSGQKRFVTSSKVQWASFIPEHRVLLHRT